MRVRHRGRVGRPHHRPTDEPRPCYQDPSVPAAPARALRLARCWSDRKCISAYPLKSGTSSPAAATSSMSARASPMPRPPCNYFSAPDLCSETACLKPILTPRLDVYRIFSPPCDPWLSYRLLRASYGWNCFRSTRSVTSRFALLSPGCEVRRKRAATMLCAAQVWIILTILSAM